jgi:bifunctional DNA-binding transcriptional regulator/antitoxin component of YhaV-PrlF toxin-antitoxin module
VQTSNIPSAWRQRVGSSIGQPLERIRRTTLSAEQMLFLRRFGDLLEKRREHADRLPESDWRRRLIDKALYSTYQDCLALDVGEEARAVLQHDQPITSR